MIPSFPTYLYNILLGIAEQIHPRTLGSHLSHGGLTPFIIYFSQIFFIYDDRIICAQLLLKLFCINDWSEQRIMHCINPARAGGVFTSDAKALYWCRDDWHNLSLITDYIRVSSVYTQIRFQISVTSKADNLHCVFAGRQGDADPHQNSDGMAPTNVSQESVHPRSNPTSAASHTV